MAENKKSIIVYADWIELFESLTDDEAGRLIKHFFRYVNDLNPSPPDRITELSFIPIKQSLKRDLDKWEGRLSERSLNGRKGNLKKYYTDIYEEFESGNITLEQAEELAKHRKTSHSEEKHRIATKKIANIADNVSVNDSVSVSVNVSDSDILLKKETKKVFSEIYVPEIQKKPRFNFKKKLLDYGFQENLVEDWLLVRKNKKATNTETAFESFISEIEKRECNINEMLKICVENSWSGFKHVWVDNLNKNNNGKQIDNSGNGSNKGYKPAEVDREALLRELEQDVANGNIPGDYSRVRYRS